MTWITVIRLLLSLANTIAGTVRQQLAEHAGEAKHLAKDLAELQRKLAISDLVAAETDRMTDQEVDEELLT